MKDNLKLVQVDKNYCDFLRKYDNKVMYNAKDKSLRPFIGVLFKINNCKYFAPLSSPKKKHQSMKNKIDFYKIDNGNLGAINFNNMIPVNEKQITYIDLDKNCNNSNEEKYQKMLKEQWYWLNRNSVILRKRAKMLYVKYISGNLGNSVQKRCCNFKLLEEKCVEYSKIFI